MIGQYGSSRLGTCVGTTTEQDYVIKPVNGTTDSLQYNPNQDSQGLPANPAEGSASTPWGLTTRALGETISG